MNSVFKNSSSTKSFIRSSFSLSESSFPSFILTILYIVSVSDISSSISTNSSFVNGVKIFTPQTYGIEEDRKEKKYKCLWESKTKT